ncbi:MAG: hypothetical protein GX364_08930 [Firmicutes bacterium]|jgi:F420-0:gamma-glutamyl ligase|nr:hypothetical protein [Bacillota bacterium]
MGKLPNYLGPMAFGIKMGVIAPGMNLEELILEALEKCSRDGLIDDNDIICITESVVARAQNNFVTIDDVAREVTEKLSLPSDGRVGVVFPITSRNRFVQVLRGIARAVPRGEVVIQFSFPCDEVGNRLVDPEFVERLAKTECDTITESDLEGYKPRHPVTGVDYISLYKDTVREAGAVPKVILSNDPQAITAFSLHGVIAADIHSREKTKAAIGKIIKNCITLQEICNSGKSRSEWGVLGSNISSGDNIKLAPRDGRQFVLSLQNSIATELGRKIEVLIYGDGAYCDPTSGIYELADPRPVFAATDGLNRLREGIKYKYLADMYLSKGADIESVEKMLEKKKKEETVIQGTIESEGTTPRPLGDVLASLADLVSGSSDAGTPIVLIKGFLK